MTMPPRRVWIAALLLALMAVIGLRIAGQDRAVRAGLGLANPCIEPLRWKMGAADPRFGLPTEEFQDAVLTAMRVWERSTGKTLFRHDPVNGMPISLVYDQRQADMERRIARRDRLREMDAEIGRLQDRHNRAVATMGRRLRTYNADVQRWNRRRGSEVERRRLERERTEIEALRRKEAQEKKQSGDGDDE